jgi:aryl-alcohol dehydrogenase-like predicted oxidoreductase
LLRALLRLNGSDASPDSFGTLFPTFDRIKTLTVGEIAMEMRTFGGTGMQVGVLGFGAGEIGSENTPYPIVDRILGEALDAGLNVIDTAPLYSDSEEKLGRALSGRRDRFLLFTKCGRRLPGKGSWTGFRLRAERKFRRWRDKADPPEFQSPEWHPRVLEWNIEQSLKRLKTDRIDLIQLHSCSEETLRHGAVIEVLEKAREAGKVRHIGYSGDGKAALYAVRCGHFASLQTSINIADQEALALTVPLARKQGMGVIAKRPIANVLWKIPRPQNRYYQPYWDRLQELRYDFLEQQSALEVAVRFPLSISGVHTMIVGTTNPAHFRQNVEFAAAGLLDEGQVEAIRTRWKNVARMELEKVNELDGGRFIAAPILEDDITVDARRHG